MGDGHAEVEIVALKPSDDASTLASAAPQGPPPAPKAVVEPIPNKAVVPAGTPGRWLQIAAYTDPINALAMRDELIRHGLAGVVVSQRDRKSTRLNSSH